MADEYRMKCWPIRGLITYRNSGEARADRREFMHKYGIDVFVDLASDGAPTMSDGFVLWLVYTTSRSSSPSDIQLSYPTWAEGARAVQSLRARLRKLPILRAHEYSEQKVAFAQCEDVIRQFAVDNGFVDDGRIWHRSGDWLDRKMGGMYEPDMTWREWLGDRAPTCWDGE